MSKLIRDKWDMLAITYPFVRHKVPETIDNFLVWLPVVRLLYRVWEGGYANRILSDNIAPLRDMSDDAAINFENENSELFDRIIHEKVI